MTVCSIEKATERALYYEALRKYSHRIKRDPHTAEGFPFSPEFYDYRLAVRDLMNVPEGTYADE